MCHSTPWPWPWPWIWPWPWPQSRLPDLGDRGIIGVQVAHVQLVFRNVTLLLNIDLKQHWVSEKWILLFCCKSQNLPLIFCLDFAFSFCFALIYFARHTTYRFFFCISACVVPCRVQRGTHIREEAEKEGHIKLEAETVGCILDKWLGVEPIGAEINGILQLFPK